jgi:hypothetical protein
MPSDQAGDAALDPSFFEGRFLIEIESWSPKLHVGLSRESVPMADRFQGGLDYIRNFELFGRIVAPKAFRTRTVRAWLQPFDTETQFGTADPGDCNEVGRLYFHLGQEGGDLSAALMLPEDAISFAATCLAATWRYVHIWTFDADHDSARLSAFSFSSTVHKNLVPWIDES